MAIWTLFSRTCDLCKRVVPRMGDSSVLPALRNRNKRYPILLFDLISTNTGPSLNAELPHRYFSDTVIRTTAGLPPACRLPYTTTVEFYFFQIEALSTLMESVPTVSRLNFSSSVGNDSGVVVWGPIMPLENPPLSAEIVTH